MLDFRIASFFLLVLLAAGAGTRVSGQPNPTTQTEIKAIEFLKREVPAWSSNNGCFSCHNNGDAARALYAASRKGHHIATEVLADTTAWVAQPARWEQNKGDPAFSDKRLANLQFAAALLAAFEAGHVGGRERLQEAARRVAADQDLDGAWHIERADGIGSPATYGTPLATYMALRVLRKSGSTETKEAVQKAERWLGQVRANSIVAAATLLLASALDSSGSSAFRREECLRLIRRAQTLDGGWGPYPDSPPEPFDTAIVLLALANFPQKPGVGDSVLRGRSFLAAQQNSDGSWPATTRPPGGDSYAQRLSTTGWATLALLATREKE
jgi:hypothetical protein